MNMKSVFLRVHRLIAHSYFVRLVLAPIILAKRAVDRKKYRESEDSKFIKEYHNKYVGNRCFIIGNGPSLIPEDLNLIINEISFASNRIYKMYDKTKWRPTFYVCIDRQNLIDDIGIIKRMKGSIKLVAYYAKRYGRKKEDELHYILLSGKYTPNELKKIHGGGVVQSDISMYTSSSQSVTCNMLEIAFYMGFKEIYLIGVDHNFPISIDRNGKKTVNNKLEGHFSGGGFLDKKIDFVYYDALTDSYQLLADYAKKNGIKVYNATRGGKLEVFERINLESIISGD